MAEARPSNLFILHRAATLRREARQSGKSATAHTLRHSCAAHLFMSGDDIRMVQELLGHRSVKATMLCIHGAPAGLF